MRDIAKAAVRLLLGLAVLVGVPVWLSLTVGWPLPRAVPSWAEITDGFSRQGVQTDTVIRVLAVIVWCAWAQLAVAIALEAAAAVRGHTTRRLALLPGTQHLARQFVASATLVLSMLGHGRAASATPGHTPQLAVIDVAPATAVATAEAAATTTRVTTPVPAGEHVVQPGDSYWGLAETHLGDGSRWAEIRDANIGRTVDGGRVITDLDDDLHPGWRILLPTTDQATVSSPTSSRRSSEVEVAPGDHFWGLAESHLRDTWGRPVTEQEVRAYWSVLVDANRDRLAPPGDPSQIYAGQVFATPDPGPDPTRPARENPVSSERQGDQAYDPVPDEPSADDAHEGADPAPEAPLGPPTSEQADRNEPGGRGEADIEQPTPAESATDPDGTPSSTPTTPTTAAGSPGGPPSGPDRETTDVEDGGEQGSAAPVVPVLGVAGTALAVAVLRELRRRRARRAAQLPVDAVPPAPPQSARPAAEEVLAADEDQVDALDAALASLCAGLNPRGGEACIRPKVVQVKGRRVEVMVDRPDPSPPPPWRPEASGRVWVLDDTSELTVPDTAAPMPALVTIGVDHAELLIDLEAFGVVTLAGDPDSCSAMARSIVTELAAKPDGAICIELVGPLDGRLDDLDTLDGVRRVDSWDEVDTGVIASSARMLDAGRWPHTFAARASGRVFDGWAPAVWITAPSDDGRYLDAVEQVAARPGAGTAMVILAGDVNSPSAGGMRIVIDPDGSFHVPELSLAGRAQLLDAAAVDQVLDLLDDAAHTTYAETIDFPMLDLDDDTLVDDEDLAIVGLDDDWSPPDDTENEPEPSTTTAVADSPSGDDVPVTDQQMSPRSLTPDDDRYEDPSWKVLVRVCGEIAVEGGKSVLTGPEAAAATYVTLHREADIDQIRDAIWGGRDVSRKRVRNVLANVRRSLGEDMDYVTEGRLAASEHCLTDHELIRRRLAYARHQTDPAAQVETLRGALEWVTGKVCSYPSRSRRTWNWIDLDNWIPTIESTVGAVAHDLAALYLDRGDADGAIWAASRGIDATGPRELLTILLVRGYALAGDDPAAAAALRAYERYMEDLEVTDYSDDLLALFDRYLPAGRARAS